MKIILINPPRFNDVPVGREDRCENTIPNVITPHGFVYLAGLLLKKNHNVELIDANGYDFDFGYIKKEIEKGKPDIVIFKSTPETFYSDIKVGDIVKGISKKIQTVMICYSLTTIPIETLERAINVDVYITDYDYEISILELVNNTNLGDINGIAYRDNKGIIVNSPNYKRFDFSSLPTPAWNLIPNFSVYWVQVPSIRPCVFVESMKGCGMGCSFCTIADLKPIFRDVEKVADEIEYLQGRGVKYINFFDATFNINRKRLIEICEEMIGRDLKIEWFANVRADITKKQAELMKQAGCRGVSIGIESGSQEVLNLVNKRINVLDAKIALQNLKKVGIKQYTSFIVGLPGETKETIKKTKVFIKETKPTGFQVNSLVPYPRCKLYKDAVKQGKIGELKFEDLLLYETPVSLCDLSIDEINEYRKKIYRDIYLSPSWWLSNIRYAMKNPNDLRLGFDYAFKVFRRLVKVMEKEI